MRATQEATSKPKRAASLFRKASAPAEPEVADKAKLQEAHGELAALRVPESVPPEHK